jgi:hypothetical protein
MIQERIRQGVYVKDIAAELGVHPRTMSRALQRGASPPGERPAAHKSKLDRYKPVIDRLLAAGDGALRNRAGRTTAKRLG